STRGTRGIGSRRAETTLHTPRPSAGQTTSGAPRGQRFLLHRLPLPGGEGGGEGQSSTAARSTRQGRIRGLPARPPGTPRGKKPAPRRAAPRATARPAAPRGRNENRRKPGRRQPA